MSHASAERHSHLEQVSDALTLRARACQVYAVPCGGALDVVVYDAALMGIMLAPMCVRLQFARSPIIDP